MAKVFTKPYPEGFKNKPDKTTPITAEVMDTIQDGIAALDTKVETLETSGGGVVRAYVINDSKLKDASFLSLSENGSPLTPSENTLYVVQTRGKYYSNEYMWNGDEYRICGQHVNQIYNANTSETIDYIFPAGTAINRASQDAPEGSSYGKATKYEYVIPKGTGAITLRINLANDALNCWCKHGVEGKFVSIGYTSGYPGQWEWINNQYRATSRVEIAEADWGKKYICYLGWISSDGSFARKINSSFLDIEYGTWEDFIEYLTSDDGQTQYPGLLPGYSGGEEAFFSSSGEWITITELKTKLGIA